MSLRYTGSSSPQGDHWKWVRAKLRMACRQMFLCSASGVSHLCSSFTVLTHFQYVRQGGRDRVARGTEGQRKRTDSHPLSRTSRLQYSFFVVQSNNADAHMWKSRACTYDETNMLSEARACRVCWRCLATTGSTVFVEEAQARVRSSTLKFCACQFAVL